jgi:hypothetical protein
VKRQTNLSLLSEHRLNAYTLAATAAGVGVLCLTQAAEAKVVYTPADVKIVQNGGSVRIDLNHDGIADFGLSNTWQRVSSRTFADLLAAPLGQANEIRGVYSTSSLAKKSCAAALPRGREVGPKGLFLRGPNYGLFMVNNNSRTPFGPWLHVKQAYLGLKFAIKGKTHFGWARVKLSINQSNRSITATLTGYAYETIPGKPIIAGATKGPDEQAGSLGALAAGAVGR